MLGITRIGRLKLSKSVIEYACGQFYSNDFSANVPRNKYLHEQMAYIKNAVSAGKTSLDWNSMKDTVLSKPGNINKNNIDAVLLKFLTNNEVLDSAISFATYLRNSNSELNLGTINSLFTLYYSLGKQNKLTEEDKSFILKMYDTLHDKYKILDSTTGTNLLQALCVINEWEKASKILEDIYESNIPPNAAFSTLVLTLFKLNKRDVAFQVIERSVQNGRPLKDEAYVEWINFIFRNFKTKKMQLKYLDEINKHLSEHLVVVSEFLANQIKEAYGKLGWTGTFTKIKKFNGQCFSCKENLECIDLGPDEFALLQKNVKEKLIVGSDLFVKTTPAEISRFQDFIGRTAPYDIVLDALNIFYAPGKEVPIPRKIRLFFEVVNHFLEPNKKILILGRKHMEKMLRNSQYNLLSDCYTFFTEDLSQDDPFFIAAAILSGPQTDIVSKDILRSHLFRMQDEKLRLIFQRWRWRHQWMVFTNKYTGTNVQPPLTFMPFAQQKNYGWHLPYDKLDADRKGQVRDGTPDLASWLCLKPDR